MANMSNTYFLGRVARAYPKEHYGEIKIWSENEKIILQVNSCQYCYDTLDECIESVKDNFVSLWISHIHSENHKTPNQ